MGKQDVVKIGALNGESAIDVSKAGGVVEILLREEFGGIQELGSKADAILWAQRQAREWAGAFGKTDSRQNITMTGMNDDARRIYEGWKSLESTIETIDALELTSSAMFGGRVQNNLIMPESPAGKALRWVNDNLDDIALGAAFAAANASFHTVDWESPSSTAGVVHYTRLMSNMRDMNAEGYAHGITLALSRAEAKYHSVTKSVDDLNGRVSSLMESMNATSLNYTRKFNEVYESGLAQLTTVHEEQIGTISSQHEAAKDTLKNFDVERKKGIEELENWRAAFREEVRLEPAARLWTGLAKHHSASAIHSGISSIVVGISGVVLTPVIAFQLMKWIGQKFAEIGGPNSALSDAGKAAELTFHYQIIFSGAVTLLWLTMFLWLMRVLVRRHTMQRRLAIDAAGRAALTQTYLGLIQDGAVNENERPIVLASLFLPVTDNSVDDGPPATSLASILAAIAAGKSGAG